jgi:cation:H+ antiporter
MFTNGLEFLAIPAFIIGVIFLYKGSDILVDGVSKTAAQLGISALIISVLLVGFGTSSPELAISVGSAIQNNPDSAGISLGNIIGSCIANLMLVLGLSSIIRPIKIQKKIIKREAPILVGATIILVIFSAFNLLDNYRIIGGVLFLIFFALFVWFFIRCAKKERVNDKPIDTGKTTKNILFIMLGIAGVVFGAWLLIESAVTIATLLDINPFIIALSMVAIGTSLPELVVSSVAAYRGESDIAVGNVLGSNVFNILLILGIAALFIPLGAINSMDNMIILLLVTLLMIPICCTNHTISRIEGFFMLVIYGVYIWYIFIGCTIIPAVF